MGTVLSQGWEWAGLVVTQALVVILTLLDRDGYEEAAERWLAALAWPGLALLAFVRVSFVGRPPVHMAGLATIAVGCVIVATLFKPGLIVGSSVKRNGVTVRSLAARQIAGWLSIIPGCFIAYFYIVAVDGLDLPL
jgi:hypothetical protein